MKKISYSQYSQWAVCPHKWKLNYIDGLRTFKGNIHTLFGSAMHDVLQTYLTVMYNDNIKKADALPLASMLLHRMKNYYKDIVEDLHSTIMSLQKYEYENNTEVIYCDRYNEVTITINMSEVEGEAFVESLDRRSTPKYIAEKTWIDKSSPYKED